MVGNIQKKSTGHSFGLPFFNAKLDRQTERHTDKDFIDIELQTTWCACVAGLFPCSLQYLRCEETFAMELWNDSKTGILLKSLNTQKFIRIRLT